MTNVAKAKQRNKTGRNVAVNGKPSKSGRYLGRASDGTLIARPDFKPHGFTLGKLQKVIRDVKKREAETSPS